MSNDRDLIHAIVNSHGIPLSGAIIKDSRPGRYFFAIIPIKIGRNGRQEPSKKRIDEASLALNEQGIHIDFILSEPETADIEEKLRSTLASIYSDSIISITLALRGKKAVLWVENSDEEIDAAMRNSISTFFALFQINDFSIHITSNKTLPSILACLRIIRKTAPATVDQICDSLKVASFDIPSDDWLSRRLDVMRKNGKVVRLRNGNYVLTADALQKLGTVKGRSSPDVGRMLALARQSG